MNWILILIIVGGLIGVGLLTAVCICAHRTRSMQPSDCIIVLGARVRPGGAMSDSLRYRCERALEAWTDGVSENIIVCGAQGGDEPAPEGELMRAYFMEMGVPSKQVIAETNSHNTKQNLTNAAQIMRAQGWKTAAIVTSDYHVQRALWLARDLGLPACGIATQSPKMPKRIADRMRETVSWVLYYIRRLQR